MPISWNEIRQNAIRFSREWAEERREEAEAKSFWDNIKAAVEAKAQALLAARKRYPLATLADLYDPLSMPADLVKAHADLDRAVDQCYRQQPFTSDRQRVEFLFALYERTTAPLLPSEPKMCARSTPRSRSAASKRGG